MTGNPEVARLAKELASQAKRAREATVRRNEAIRELREYGAALRQIAAVAGMSHAAVAKILAR